MPERPPNAEPIPLTRLSELHGTWSMMVWCDRCGRRTILPADGMRERHGDASLYDFCTRLRCDRITAGMPGSRCRGIARRVELRKHQTHGKSSKIVREWVIWTLAHKEAPLP